MIYNDPNLKFAYKPQSLESLQGSIVDFKKLKPSTQVYINKLKRLKYNDKEPLNSIGIFPSDIPNEFILKAKGSKICTCLQEAKLCKIWFNSQKYSKSFKRF